VGHEYGVGLTVLSITATRDNIAAPGNRMPDKHSRLFCGKTLDEWTMLQLWSSRSVTRKIFVCETQEHANRLSPLADKYGVELMVRPRQMLHPLNDTGLLPVSWAFKEATKREYYSLFINPAFVITPCRPPGFHDEMVAFYLKTFGNPDYILGVPSVLAGFSSDLESYELKEGRGHILGSAYYNRNPIKRVSRGSHAICAGWYYESQVLMQLSRHYTMCEHEFSMAGDVMWDIEPWMDIHIDTEDEWKEAEFWFKEKILSQGEDCYERYRKNWSGSIVSGVDTGMLGR
jgi:hypothetical protein